MEILPDASSFDADEYTIATPENVTFGYQVAGIGSRFIGALIDTLLIGVLLLLLNLLAIIAINSLATDSSFTGALSDDPGWLAGLVLALYALLNFTTFWGYYLIFELGWQGQTPGKRLAGTRVVKLDGSGPNFLEVAIRNLVRLVDFLPAAYALGFVTMFFNRNARRLGDFAAGTLVVRQSDVVRIDALVQTGSIRAPQGGSMMVDDNQTAHIPNLRRLTGDDYQLICTVLDRQMHGRADPKLTLRLARAMATKLGTLPPGETWRDAQRFLYQVAEAYRQAANHP